MTNGQISGVNDRDAQRVPTAHASVGENQVPPRTPDSALASQLPEWDLLPSDLLLVRRRPVNL